jgi:hypothetical protein
VESITPKTIKISGHSPLTISIGTGWKKYRIRLHAYLKDQRSITLTIETDIIALKKCSNHTSKKAQETQGISNRLENGVDLDWTHLLPLPHARTKSRTTSPPANIGKIPPAD